MQSISRVPRKVEKDTSTEDILRDLKSCLDALEKMDSEITDIKNRLRDTDDSNAEDHVMLSDKIDQFMNKSLEKKKNGYLRVSCATMSMTILTMLTVTNPGGHVLFLGLTISAIGAAVSLYLK